MIYADLHCDTATKLYRMKNNLSDDSLQLSQRQTSGYEKIYQCFAVFFDDTSVAEGSLYIEKVLTYFSKKIQQQPNIVPIYTVEGGGMIGTDPNSLLILQQFHIRIFGFAWNGRNSLATGAYTNNTKGLSPLGLEYLEQLNQLHILPDVSHLSEQGFYDIVENTEQPVVATHSNARAVCEDLRNLTDDQIRCIIQKKGLIGLNLHAPFLNKETATMTDIVRHADHILQLGGEDILALGCDFDGTKTLPVGFSGASDIKNIIQTFTQEFGATVAEKISVKNALRVLEIN